MLKAAAEESLIVLHEILGGWFTLIMLGFAFGAVNFMFVWVKGIQYLDREFSPDKQYDDTWTYSAGSRFIDYCRAYLRGKIKTERFGIHVWMCFNSVTHVMTTLLLLYMLLFSFYKWIVDF